MKRKNNYFIPLIPLYCGLAYILGIIYFVGIANLSSTSVAEKIAGLGIYYTSMFIVINLIYVVFGVMITFLSFLMYQLFKKTLLNKVALAFGLFWSFAVIIAGVIFNLGMKKVLEINITDPTLAIQTWTIIEIIFDSVGGGTEILGGIWILLVSILAIKNNVFNVYINGMGIIIGISGILSHIPSLEFFQMIFGILQIVWFFTLPYPFYKIFK